MPTWRPGSLPPVAHASTCASAASVSGSQKVISISRYISIAVDSAVRACSRWPVAAYSVPRPRWQCACSGTHAKLLGQGKGLAVVGFCLRDIGGISVGLDDAKLVQCEPLLPTGLLLAGQVERLARVLQGFCPVSLSDNRPR